MSAKKEVVVSKTARASRGVAKVKFMHNCKECTAPCEATLCVTETGHRIGMKWICPNGHWEATRG